MGLSCGRTVAIRARLRPIQQREGNHMSAQLTRDDWKSRIGGLSYRNQAFIGGKFAASLTGKTFDCINPATGQILTKVAACEQADVDAAVKAARTAFEKGTWANMPPD